MGWKPKDKAVGFWMDECYYCKERKGLCAERDYHKPDEKSLTLDELLIYKTKNDL